MSKEELMVKEFSLKAEKTMEQLLKIPCSRQLRIKRLQAHKLRMKGYIASIKEFCKRYPK